LKKQSAYLETVNKNLKKTLSSQRFWRAHSDTVNIRLLADWMPDSNAQSILKTDLFDEAFSEGLYPFLDSQSKTVICIDISRSILKDARARYNDLRVIEGDVRRLPFADRTFDVVVSNSTLDHFETHDEIVSSLYELHRVLRTNGLLLLTLDNPVNPIVSIRNSLPFKLVYRLGLVPYYVGATFGPGRTRRILEHIGFEVKDVTAIMHCPRILAVAMTRILNNYGKNDMQRRFLSFLMSFEFLSRLPTRFLTGYFVAVRAIKR
jgi:SAM-dependent methyltransferase